MNKEERDKKINFYCDLYDIERNKKVEDFFDNCVMEELLLHYPEDSQTCLRMFKAYQYLNK